MTDRFKGYYYAIKAFMQRRWAAARRYDFGRLWKPLAAILEVLPGILAWLLELAAISMAIGCVVLAGHQSYEGQLWGAAGLIGIAGGLMGLATLSDYYTSPRNPKQGGGG